MIRPTELIDHLKTGTLHGPIPTESTMKLLHYILHLESQRMTREEAESEFDEASSQYYRYMMAEEGGKNETTHLEMYRRIKESLITLLTGSAGSEKPQPECECLISKGYFNEIICRKCGLKAHNGIKGINLAQPEKEGEG